MTPGPFKSEDRVRLPCRPKPQAMWTRLLANAPENGRLCNNRAGGSLSDAYCVLGPDYRRCRFRLMRVSTHPKVIIAIPASGRLSSPFDAFISGMAPTSTRLPTER